MHWRQERLDTKYGREVRINQMRPLLSSVLIFFYHYRRKNRKNSLEKFGEKEKVRIFAARLRNNGARKGQVH